MRKYHNRFIWSIIFAMIVGLSVQTSYGQKPNKRGVQDVSSRASSNLVPGANYALVIGNNNYRYVKKLQTAVNDANAVAQLLREQYGFTTTVLRLFLLLCERPADIIAHPKHVDIRLDVGP
jgi:hypothetical protein